MDGAEDDGVFNAASSGNEDEQGGDDVGRLVLCLITEIPRSLDVGPDVRPNVRWQLMSLAVSLESDSSG